MGYAFMAKQTNTSREWRLLAERDMSVANYLAANMRPVPAEAIVFHCQQAAEKYLKGVLVIVGEDPPYIHDLNKRGTTPLWFWLKSFRRWYVPCSCAYACCQGIFTKRNPRIVSGVTAPLNDLCEPQNDPWEPQNGCQGTRINMDGTQINTD